MIEPFLKLRRDHKDLFDEPEWATYRRLRKRLSRVCGPLAGPLDRDMELFNRILESYRAGRGL